MTIQEFKLIPKHFAFLSDGLVGSRYLCIEWKRTNNAIIEREIIPITDNKIQVLREFATFTNGKHYEKINGKWIFKDNYMPIVA